MSRELIEALNQNLQQEMMAIIMYLNHSYMVLGPDRKAMSGTLKGIARQEMNHMEQLAKRIVGMGGTPTVKYNQVTQTDRIDEMLRADANAEKSTIERYVRNRNLAEQEGDLATVNMLENIITQEQEHLDEFNKMLKRNPLEG